TAQILSGILSGAGGLHKAYGGTLTLSGSNTYSGRTSFMPQTTAGFTVNITSFNSVNGGTPLMASSSLGAPTSVTNGTIDIGEIVRQASVSLNYTGPGETTDRILNFGFSGSASLTLSASGSGLLKFTSAMTANTLTTQSGSLILRGTGSGEITQALPALPGGGLSKNDSGTWTLGGTNSYTSPTAIIAGKLFINGDQSSATGNVSVAANATLGGTGTLGGNTTIAANGKLEFNLSTPAGSHNGLELASGRSLTFSGASVLTITSAGGAATGTYTLLTAPGGITGSAPATLNLPDGWVATVSISGNNLLLNVASIGATPYYTLTVTSPYGTATPMGVTTSNWNTVINATVSGSPVLNGTTQYMATGWIGTGSLANGSGTNTSFSITNNTTISWVWQTNYWINLQVIGN
ncbi:MAG TPA: hypothetical protein DCS43_05660, partial [Verrucomicrobia bacterium]|nr:hypothetical protein [Verrucomicrobiota bacterium]